MTNKEVINKLSQDTNDGKIKWEVDLTYNYAGKEARIAVVKTSHDIKITEKKKLVFKIMYYVDHPKNTKLSVNFITNVDGVNSSKTISDMGGKKREESRIINQLISKILLDYENLKDKIEIERDDVFNIGDRVVVIREQDFPKEKIVGQKGTIIKELERDGNARFLVEFDNKFNDALFDEKKFDYGATRVDDGNCWLMDPNNIRKIISKETNEKIKISYKEFIKKF